MRGTRLAFTLVELLVVVGIIATLVAILFPVFARARHSARKTGCASNLRQIGMALTMYSDDQDEQGPPVTGWHIWGGDGTNGDHPGPGWEERIFAYVKSKDLFRCPAAPAAIQFAYFLNTRYYWLSWGSPGNPWGISWIVGPSIQCPSCYVVAGDCSNPHLFPPPLGTSPLTEDSCDKDNMTYRCLSYDHTFHGNGSNVLFADGHVKFATRFDDNTMTLCPWSMADWE